MANYQNFFIQTVARSATNLCSRLSETELLPQELYAQALTLLDLAFQPQIATEVWSEIYPLILILSPKVEQAGYWDDWIIYLSQALALSQSMGEPQSEAAISIKLGILLQRRGEFEAAQTHFRNSIQLAQAADDRSLWASALNRMGFIALLQSQTTEARHYLEEALELAVGEDLQSAFTYLLLGRVAQGQKKMEQAVEYLQKSISLARASEDAYQIAMGLNDLGILFYRQSLWQDALDVYEQCIAQWARLDNPVEWSVATMNKGIIYEASGDLQAALDCYSEAKPALEKSQNGHNLARLYNNQGYCYTKLDLWDEAEKSYKTSLVQAYPLGNWYSYADTLDGLGRVYHAQENYEKAVETFQEALHHLSKVTDEDVTRELAQEIRQHLQRSQC